MTAHVNRTFINLVDIGCNYQTIIKKNLTITPNDNNNLTKRKFNQLGKKPMQNQTRRSSTTEVTCYNLWLKGHYSMSYPKPQLPRNACYNCYQEGHLSRDFPLKKKEQ